MEEVVLEEQVDSHPQTQFLQLDEVGKLLVPGQDAATLAYLDVLDSVLP